MLGDSMSNRQVCHGGQNEQREWHYPGDGGEKQRDGALRGRDERACCSGAADRCVLQVSFSDEHINTSHTEELEIRTAHRRQ